ncbi:MAG: hypothetical protein JSV24_05765 [Bacteroidales bacterium]|nr:MAG: hypothetical protein JSV24_05765 [Bacteroidales bacterium]
MYTKRSFLILWFGYILLLPAAGQINGYYQTPDTVLIRGGNYIMVEDSVIFIPRDTVLIIPGTTNFLVGEDMYKNSVNFYDSLQSRASRKKWSRLLHEMLFVSSSKVSDGAINRKSEDQYVIHQGKKIRNIEIIRADIFGPTLLDTTVTSLTWVGHTLNKLHFYTNEKIIKNNLLLNTGDEINPLLLADNERILRKLKFIDDASIQVIPVSGELVDVYVITKDVFSLGFNASFKGLKPELIEIYERNILGIGHEFHTNLLYDYDAKTPFGFEALYRVSNIKGSFIRGEVGYMDSYFNKYYGVVLSRKFVTPLTKYAGGIKISVESNLVSIDTTDIYYRFKRNYQNYWFGRSFLLNPVTRTRIILAGRFIHNNVFERPVIPENSNHNIQEYELYLGSVAFSKMNFYKTNLIYNYGRTEDIPYGSLVELTGGFEKNEFGNRFYTSMYVSGGNFLPRLGYLQSSVAVGGFIRNGAYRQGVIQTRASYFSNTFSLNNFHFRQFVNLDYTLGIRPFLDEQITINNTSGIRGLSSDYLSGTHRLALKLETVSFTPLFLYGFRFACFGFADLGLVGPYNKSIFTNTLYSGLGFGIRIRNENLVFKTFQVRFAFYPVLPTDYSKNLIYVSGEKLLSPNDFTFITPEPLKFR